MEMTPWAAGATAIRGAAPVADAPAKVEPEVEAEVDGAVSTQVDDDVQAEVSEARRQKPRRGRKPQINRDADEPGTRIVLTPGTSSGVEVRDLVAAITEASGLDGEAVRDVLVLERFALATVPSANVDEAVDAINERAGGDRALYAEVLVPR